MVFSWASWTAQQEAALKTWKTPMAGPSHTRQLAAGTPVIVGQVGLKSSGFWADYNVAKTW